MFLQCATLTEKHDEYNFVHPDRLAEPTTGHQFLQQQQEADGAKMFIHCAQVDKT